MHRHAADAHCQWALCGKRIWLCSLVLSVPCLYSNLMTWCCPTLMCCRGHLGRSRLLALHVLGLFTAAACWCLERRRWAG